MNFKEHLLGKIAEEACEVGQIAIKAQQFGLDSWHPDDVTKTNRDLLVGELNDLLAVVMMLDPSIALEIEIGNAAQAAKVIKVQHYRARTC